ncbi:hypothetical protein [Actinomycetospora sp. CA-084318]|uniref:hypothetical protein n=1 Tax=Actinomycetospora sp. CA-084318 TaxID=3239892 RepID=UPI003D999ABF
MNGGNVRRSDLGRLPLGRWAAGGALVALAGLLVVVLTSTDKSFLLGGILVLVGSLAVAAVVVIAVVRRELLGHVEYVNEVVERGVVEVLPPGRVAERLLDRVYGPSPYNQALLTALLGGEGRAGDGGDLTISEHTEIDYRLTRLDEANYHLVMETKYTFRKRVPTRNLVIFATSDETLRDMIVKGCRFPLFEMWFVREDETKSLFEDSVESLRDSVLVGVEHADGAGRTEVVEARHPGKHLREVRVRDWGGYLAFFGAGGAFDQALWMDRLRIFEIDLHGLARRPADVGAIQRLTLCSTTLQHIDDGFCWWQAPYPCFVERMSFDTRGFDLPGGEELRFNVKPFATEVRSAPAPWFTSDGVASVDLQAWLVPGHGMTLFWRPTRRT